MSQTRAEYIVKLEKAIKAIMEAQESLIDVNMTLVGSAQSHIHTTLQCLRQAKDGLLR